MSSGSAKAVRKVSATKFREHYRSLAAQAKGKDRVLVENRRQSSKYLVDKEWLDALLRERESILATLEILTDRTLTERLLKVSKRVDADVRAGRLHSMEEVFGKE